MALIKVVDGKELKSIQHSAPGWKYYGTSGFDIRTTFFNIYINDLFISSSILTGVRKASIWYPSS